MQTEEKQMKMSYLIKRFVPYFKKYKWILILDLICASLTTVCELVFPMLVRYITNMGINNIAGLTVGIILKIGLFYLILRIIDSAANFYMADTGHIMGAKIEVLFSQRQKVVLTLAIRGCSLLLGLVPYC